MKRIVAALLAVLMITAMLPITAVAEASTPVALTVSADAKNAKEGEEVTFTVTMGAVTELPMQGMSFELSIPEGLTYVKGSGKEADGLKAKFGSRDTTFTDSGSKLIFVNVGGGKYTGNSDITLMTFKCKVTSELKKSVEVTLMSDKKYPVDMIGPVQADGYIETIPTTVTGCKIFLGDFMPGDANGDGKITMTDVLEALRAYLEGDYIVAVDFDGNNRITMDDVLATLQAYLEA